MSSSNVKEALAKHKQNIEEKKRIEADVLRERRREEEACAALEQMHDRESKIAYKKKREERKLYSERMVTQLFVNSVHALESNDEAERDIFEMIENQGSTQLCLLETNWNTGVNICWSRILPENYSRVSGDDFIDGVRSFGARKHTLSSGPFKGWQLRYEVSWVLAYVFVLIVPTQRVRLVLSEPKWYNLWNFW